MTMLSRFWQDEAGFVVSSELVLIATLVVLGLVAGLTEVRNGVVQELGDLASTFGSINQQYSYSGVTGHTSSTAGSFRVDEDDFCEATLDSDGAAPGCMSVQLAATNEN